MPFGSFVNVIPAPLFMGIHISLFVLGILLASRSRRAGSRTAARGFVLYAAAELVYLTYHLDWTLFLFAHTVSEVLVALAVVTLFVATRKRGTATTVVTTERTGVEVP